jgi:hypothetical protein
VFHRLARRIDEVALSFVGFLEDGGGLGFGIVAAGFLFLGQEAVGPGSNAVEIVRHPVQPVQLVRRANVGGGVASHLAHPRARYVDGRVAFDRAARITGD